MRGVIASVLKGKLMGWMEKNGEEETVYIGKLFTRRDSPEKGQRSQ